MDSISIRLTTGYFIANLLLQTCVKSVNGEKLIRKWDIFHFYINES